MKKLIIAIVLVGFISLGFTVVTHTPKIKQFTKAPKSEKIDFSGNLDEKRLASWD